MINLGLTNYHFKLKGQSQVLCNDTQMFVLFVMNIINPLYCFFCIEGHLALERNLGPGYNTLIL